MDHEMSDLPSHATASVFVLDMTAAEPRVLLLWHEKLQHWMIPGGHVETGEEVWQAAVREVGEETGLAVTLRSAVGGPATGAFHDVVVLPSPVWVVAEDIPDPDGIVRHRHIDHLYLALVDDGQVAEPISGCRWWTVADMPTDAMFPGTAALLKALVSRLA